MARPVRGLAPALAGLLGDLARQLRRPRVAASTVGALLAAALVARILLSGEIASMWIYSDEASYALLAEQVVDDGVVDTVASAWGTFGSFLYPLLISPAWLTDDVPTTYAVAKAINVALMTATAGLTWLWARRLVPPVWAFIAVVLVLTLPSFVYSTALITENAFFPVFVGALYAMARAFERPSWSRQLGVLLLIGAAYSVRAQGLVLLPILGSAIVVVAAVELRGRRGERLRVVLDVLSRLRIWAVALPLAAVAYLLLRLTGGGAGEGLGVYGIAASGGAYSPRTAALWVFWSFAELSLSVAFVPLAALIVVVALVLGGRMRSPAELAFAAVGGSAVLWIVLQVGVFSSRFSFDRVPQERSMFCVVPVLALALVLWLARGLPRPPRLAPIAVAVAVGGAMTLPFEAMLSVSGNHAFGLYSLWVLAMEWGLSFDEVRALLVVGAALVCVLCALRAAAARIVLPLGLAAFWVASSFLVFHDVRQQAANQRATGGIGDEADWVDRRIGGDGSAMLLYTSSPKPLQQFVTYLQADFWNRRITTEGVLQGDTYRAADLTFDPLDGRILPIDASRTLPDTEYVVASSEIALQGELLETRAPLALFRVELPLRLASSVTGRYSDGWIGAEALFTQWAKPATPGGNVLVEISLAAWAGPTFPDVPRTVTATIAPLVPGADGVPVIGTATAQLSRVLQKEEAGVLVLPAPDPPFAVHVTADPVVAPSQFGVPDDRALGVQVRFRYAS